MRIPVLTIILLFLLSFLTDWIILLDVRKYSRRHVWRSIWLWSSLGCWLFLAVTLCIPRRDSASGIEAVMWMLYSYLTVYLAKFIYIVCSVCGRIPCMWGGHRLKSALWAGLPLSAIAFSVMWWGVAVTRRQIDVNEVIVKSEKLPEVFNSYKIVQFSDAHVGTWGKDTTFVSSLVDRINSIRPDLIVFTGDIVNRQTSELEPFLKVFSHLKATDGVISVLGNHDYGDYVDWRFPSEREENNALLAVWQRQMGWNLLNNNHTFIRRGNDSIAVIGVENWGEPPFKQYGNLRKSYPLSDGKFLSDSHFKILLSHNPEHWRQEVSRISDIDLTLSGHTHAMQFMISIGDWKWSPAGYRYKQWGGLYERQNAEGYPTRLYVNIGCGEVALPFRIGAVPEITVITLERE